MKVGEATSRLVVAATGDFLITHGLNLYSRSNPSAIQSHVMVSIKSKVQFVSVLYAG